MINSRRNEVLKHNISKQDAIGRVVLLLFNIIFLGIANFITMADKSELALKIAAYVAAISSICFFAMLDWRKVYYSNKLYRGKIERNAYLYFDRNVFAILDNIHQNWIENHSHDPIRVYASYPITSYIEFFNYCSLFIRNKNYKVLSEGFNIKKAKQLSKKLVGAFSVDCKEDNLVDFLYQLPNKRLILKNLLINILFIDNYDSSFPIEEIYKKTGYRCVIVGDKNFSEQLKKLSDNDIMKYMQIDDRELAHNINDVVGGDINRLLSHIGTEIDKNKFLDFVNRRGHSVLCPIDLIISQAEDDLLNSKYLEAMARLKTIEDTQSKQLEINLLRKFRFHYAYANACHLLNMYVEAIALLTKILNDPYLNVFSKNAKVELLLAHCYKHMGSFTDSEEMYAKTLRTYNNNIVTILATRGIIGCTLLDSFYEGSISDITIKLNNHFNKLLALTAKTLTKKETDLINESVGMYKPVSDWMASATKSSHDLINAYKASLTCFICKHSRLVPNVKFSLAEAYRLDKQYDTAMPLYFEVYCAAISNHDFNLLVQSSVMIKYIELTKGCASLLKSIDFVEMHKQCIQRNMDFNNMLCKHILQLETSLSAPDSLKIIENYDNKFMIIL